jgi:hypothetical protein
MTADGDNPRDANPGDLPQTARRCIERLGEAERLLVVVCRELYEGCWDEMVADLNARRSGHPYIFRLASRIDDDLRRIGALRGLERRYGVDLGRYVDR